MIILIGGLPGSGKTYFAKRLAERIHGHYLSTDTLRKSLAAQGRYDVADKLYVYRELARATESKANDPHSHVIVDATFSHRMMRDLFVQLANKISVPFRFIWVYAEEELIRERTGKPREDSEADYNVFVKIRDQAEQVDIPHLVLQSTNNNVEAMLKKGTTYIFEDARR